MSSATPQRVLHVIPFGGMGGAAQIVVDLVRHQMADPRFDPCVAALTGGTFGGALPTDRVFELGASMSRGASLSRWRRFRALVERLRPQLVHSHLWPATSCAQMAMVGMGEAPRHVVHIHDAQPSLCGTDLRTRLRKGLLLSSLRLGPPVSRYLTVAEACQNFAIEELGLPPGSIRTIMNGTDVSRVSSLPIPPKGESFTLGAAGRFAAEKGYRYLIEAVHHLNLEGHWVRLLLAGDGGLAPDFRRQVDELGLASCVEFPGEVSDMAAFYRDLDACVFPSILPEGLPLVVLEAMAAGVPIISTACGGTGEAITDGKTGLIVEPRDAEGIAASVKWLMADPQRGERLRLGAAREVERRFDKQRMCREVAEVYAAELALPPLSPAVSLSPESLNTTSLAG